MWHPWCFRSSAKPFTLHQQILVHFFLLRCQTVAFCSLSISVALAECCSSVAERGDRTWIPPAAGNRRRGCVESFSRTRTPCFSCSITPQAPPSAPPITPAAPFIYKHVHTWRQIAWRSLGPAAIWTFLLPRWSHCWISRSGWRRPRHNNTLTHCAHAFCSTI